VSSSIRFDITVNGKSIYTNADEVEGIDIVEGDFITWEITSIDPPRATLRYEDFTLASPLRKWWRRFNA